jgi:hypothetical protein
MKAKLVIDMPDNCDDCQLCCYYEDGGRYCSGITKNNKFMSEGIEVRPEWCPLTIIEDSHVYNHDS